MLHNRVSATMVISKSTQRSTETREQQQRTALKQSPASTLEAQGWSSARSYMGYEDLRGLVAGSMLFGP